MSAFSTRKMARILVWRDMGAATAGGGTCGGCVATTVYGAEVSIASTP